MNTSPSEDESEAILTQLQSPAFRMEAIQRLRTVGSSDARVVEVLISISENDADPMVRQQAKQALLAPVHLTIIRQRHPELASRMAEECLALRATLVKRRTREGILDIGPKILAFLAGAIVILGIVALPLVVGLVASTSGAERVSMWTMTLSSTDSPVGVVSILIAGVSPFVGGKRRGWWWLVAAVLSAAILWVSARGLGDGIRVIVGSITAHFTTHTVENVKLGQGFYVAMLGTMILAGCGIWDIAQKRMRKGNTETEISGIDEALKVLN